MLHSKISNQPLPTDDNSWFCAGPVSSFPDLASTTKSNHNQKLTLSTPIPCSPTDTNTDTTQSPAAKIFQIPKPTSSSTSADPPFQVVAPDQATENSAELNQQVLVFRHRGKFHAVDHQCPHQSWPLSRGSVYDIEDFGIVLSAGILCSRHGWSFDLFTGDSDRGTYRLRVWDVEVRERKLDPGDGRAGEGVREVWVRRR